MVIIPSECCLMWSSHPLHFTALDLLYQFEQQIGQKQVGGYIYFKGLDAIEKDEGGIPMFYLICIS
ncbi:hypothetical protein [Sphingobacterium sp.]|uniref:hypothetical protein n=2 Tax=Sphingobacterium TaxID=28453 RepID=UPI0025F9A9BC|nr:hypothetical protein [Sphingobacterium sp.]